MELHSLNAHLFMHLLLWSGMMCPQWQRSTHMEPVLKGRLALVCVLCPLTCTHMHIHYHTLLHTHIHTTHTHTYRHTHRSTGFVEECPVSVSVHSFAGETVVMALCRDLKLRLWSCQVSRACGSTPSDVTPPCLLGNM